MTRTTTLSLLTAAALLSGVTMARADGVTVKLAGHSPAEVHGEIVAAARRVCAKAIHNDIFNDYDSEEGCVTATVDETVRKIAAASKDYQFAQADLSPAR